MKILLLCIIPFLRIYSGLQIGSCIRYETYSINDYKMRPFDLSDNWFTRRHYTPRKVTKVGLRSRRLYGCCDPGYIYHGYPDFECKANCMFPCPMNSHCSQGQCTCDNGYHRDFGMGCMLKYPTTQEYKYTVSTTTVEPTSPQPPCNGSCGMHEECSVSDNVCVCANGFQKSPIANGNRSVCLEVIPTSSTVDFETTTIATTSLQPPCNDSCGKHEECSMTGVCICADGYQRINSTCEPKCEPECQHATCVAPNTCNCWPNYERMNDTSCRLSCSEQSCRYGNCNQDGVCICATGFLNNGTACIWAGDAILTEPDDCDCWSKFLWQKNETEISVHQCQPLCDGDDSIEVTSECINYRQCQCYEGFLVCHAQMYKCFAAEESNYTTVTQLEEKFAEQNGLPNHMTLLIIVFLVTILIMGAILFIWQKRPNWIHRLRPYNRMNSGQEQLL